MTVSYSAGHPRWHISWHPGALFERGEFRYSGQWCIIHLPNPISSASPLVILSTVPCSPASHRGSSHSLSFPDVQTLTYSVASVCHSTPLFPSRSLVDLPSPGTSCSLPDLDTGMGVDVACSRPSYLFINCILIIYIYLLLSFIKLLVWMTSSNFNKYLNSI